MEKKPDYKELEQSNLYLKSELAGKEKAIRELTKSKKKYQELSQLLRFMVDNVPDLIWAKDMGKRHLLVNQANCDKLLMCPSTKDAVGKTNQYFAELERQKGNEYTFGELCEDSDELVIKSKRRERFMEEGIVRGKEIVLDVYKTPFYNDSGEMIGIVGCGRDVTVEKSVNKALTESERRFRKIIEDVSDISIQGYDEERRVIFWNHASEKIYGYTKDEALGRTLEDLIIPSRMKNDVIKLHAQWLGGGEKIPAGELVLVDKSGNDVPVFSSHVLHETQFGKEMFCIDIDMKPFKEAEEEKKQLEDRLRQSQKMEAIGTFVGGIAHDFNNILQSISSYAEIHSINKNPDTDDSENLTEIFKSARKGGELVKQLLLFGRKAETRKQATRINDEIRHAVQVLERTIPKMISIDLDLGYELNSVYADPVQIEQILLNLGSNAAHAMPDGGKLIIKTKKITIDHNHCHENTPLKLGEYIELTIIDTGQGMDEATRGRIFEPFFTTKEDGEGTGLGLASVYGIVETHGGKITCTSEPGKGTRFDILFPALTEILSEALQSEPVETSEGGAETILVVDDEAEIRNIIQKALSRYNYTVVTAESGEAAIELYPAEKPDLVLMDLNMPGMGGWKCMEKLLTIDANAKIILASGYFDEAIDKNIKEKMARGFIQKPYSLLELASYIRQILDK